jgi:hypothetical protein
MGGKGAIAQCIGKEKDQIRLPISYVTFASVLKTEDYIRFLSGESGG